MTTLTNSEGKVINYTNELIETILLQLNPSNNYYTTGDDVLFIKIGSNKVLILDYTYHMNRIIFQSYTINENLVNNYDSQFIPNGTSNEYGLQSAYTANGFIGTISDLPQVHSTMYDTTVSPCTYTGSENINITDIQISLKFHITINGELVLNPRLNDYFELYAGTSGITFLQNTVDGSQPTAIFNSLGKSILFFCDLDIPNFCNTTDINAIGDELSSSILNT